ncbi:hypothetical protein FB45DRAFT_1067317 [Roridomyces roridus]|uniref:Uncharacterized protein n=1 Tax=Roridomyces roridus TaxID=1738132 RepID=A0AAD7B344_9AGAR|nr:hypothetical protein FB45DRAFT_1067317 [Roridomyces roridus]
MSLESDVRVELAQQFLLHIHQLLQLRGEATGPWQLPPVTPEKGDRPQAGAIPEADELAALDEVPPDDVLDADVTFSSTSTEEAREVVEMLVWHAEDSTDFDTQKLSEAKTLRDFFLTPHIMQPTEDTGIVHKRHARAVEILPTEHQLRELAYLPNMAARFSRHVRIEKKEDLAEVQLTEEERQLMTAGASMANCWRKIYYEEDVGRHFCVTQAHAVAEAINIVEGKDKDDESRLFPHKGLPGHRRPGQSSFSDIQTGDYLTELKTPFSISSDTFTEAKLLDIDPAVLKEIIGGRTDHAFVFEYSPPSSVDDDMGVSDQPVVQLFTQLYDKEGNFAQGSSHKYSFFIIFDPETPHRLYISPCVPAFPAKVGPEAEGVSSKESPPSEDEYGIYTMYYSVRIANNKEFREEFLAAFRESIKEKLVRVWRRDPKRFAEAPPADCKARVDPARGTVGVKYYDQADAPADNLRREGERHSVKPSLEEDTTLDIEQTQEGDLIPFRGRPENPSKLPRPVPKAKGKNKQDTGMPAPAALAKDDVKRPHRAASRRRAGTQSQQPPNAPAPSDQSRLRREPSARRAATQVVQQPPVASTSAAASDRPTLRSQTRATSSSAQASSSIPKPGKGM